MAAIFEHTDTDRLAGIPLGTGTTGAAPRIAPRGPSGLWDALAKADATRAEVAPAAEDAHLAYLARVATPAHDAEVVDLAAYRARRAR